MIKNKGSVLQKNINYIFNDETILDEALSHSSYVNERQISKEKSNERLEFLGDAVLELISSEYLFKKYSLIPEGELSKLRAGMVCEKALAICARNIELGSCLMLGRGEAINGGAERDSILSDALEALIGAVYLDGGFEKARLFVTEYVLSELADKPCFTDNKTMLQEYLQTDKNNLVSYELLETYGPDHDKRFVVAVMINGKEYGKGTGKSKKDAEQQAAYETIIMLKR